jgi:hypothetical protein
MHIILKTLYGISMRMEIPDDLTFSEIRKQISNFLASNCLLYYAGTSTLDHLPLSAYHIKEDSITYVMMRLKGTVHYPILYKNETSLPVGKSIYPITVTGKQTDVNVFEQNRTERIHMYLQDIKYNNIKNELQDLFQKNV